jgi:Peptidase family M28
LHEQACLEQKEVIFKPLGPKPISHVPSTLGQQSLVGKLTSMISLDLVRKHLVRLTEFPERHYKSDIGVLAAKWLFEEVVALNSSVSP